MQLNPDCMRDCLLKIESLQTISNNILKKIYTSDLFNSDLQATYSQSDIFYAVKQLSDHSLIEATEKRTVRRIDYEIIDISPLGHDFLNNIRNIDIWSETKSKAKQVGSFALDILSKIAVNVITSRINL